MNGTKINKNGTTKMVTKQNGYRDTVDIIRVKNRRGDDFPEYVLKDYCENTRGILGYVCDFTIPLDENSKGILTKEHWDGDPFNEDPNNLNTLCANCAQYKTNKFGDWGTPGRNLKKVQGESFINPIDFIRVPWVQLCNNKLFQNTTLRINIIIGATGQGKTYSITETMIPLWSKKPHDVKLIVVSAPGKDILDVSDFKKVGLNHGYICHTEPKQALADLKNDMPVILVTTHQALVESRARQADKLLDYAKKENIKHALIMDEAHSWLCSDPANYKNTVGWKNNRVRCVLFKKLAKISKYNPYLFGLTATPNAEQRGEVDTKSDTKFKIINKPCPRQMLMPVQGWAGEMRPLDLSDSEVVKERIAQTINDAILHYRMYGVKKTVMIQCSKNTFYHFNKHTMLPRALSQTLKTFRANSMGQEFTACSMTKDGNITYSGDGKKESYDNEDDLFKKLNDHDDPLTVLLVVNKGSMGINVFTLKHSIILKKTDKDDGEGNTITEQARQTVGRAGRPNVKDMKSFKEDYSFNFFNYYMSLDSDRERIGAVESNTFTVDYPADNKMYEDALQQTKNEFYNSIGDVEKVLENLENN